MGLQSKKEKIITRTSGRQAFQRGFYIRCRICETEAVVLYTNNPLDSICNIIIKCPKCKKKNEIRF